MAIQMSLNENAFLGIDNGDMEIPWDLHPQFNTWQVKTKKNSFVKKIIR